MEENDFLRKRFAKAPFIVSRKIASKFILVPIRQKAGDIESIYNMNEVAGRIWELTNGKRRVEEIRDMIVEEFEVEPEEAGIDVVELLKQLVEVDAVREV